jgi:uncharacterized protein YeaO (DUF488 family)
MATAIKRAYAEPSRHDGLRVLVDRIWPRGLSKADAHIDEWLRDLAPSNELRKWYHSHEGSWAAFHAKYLKELERPECQAALHRLYQFAHRRKNLTLIYASKNEIHNNATVLKQLLDGRRKPPSGTGPAAVSAFGRRQIARRHR